MARLTESTLSGGRKKREREASLSSPIPGLGGGGGVCSYLLPRGGKREGKTRCAVLAFESNLRACSLLWREEEGSGSPTGISTRTRHRPEKGGGALYTSERKEKILARAPLLFINLKKEEKERASTLPLTERTSQRRTSLPLLTERNPLHSCSDRKKRRRLSLPPRSSASTGE